MPSVGPSVMKAVGYAESLPVDAPRALFDFEAARPSARPRDLIVKVAAVSVNPVDTKVRRRKAGTAASPVILGWDAVGTVVEAGPECRLFKPGDEVFYAGDITRPGSNAEYQAVDERIVGLKPRSLSNAQAAALPLTSITAWEMLFDRFALAPGKRRDQGAILIIGGAGGVGSIAIQLAKRLTGLTVIATASRPETKAWCKELGADHVIDHSQDLAEQLTAIGLPTVPYIFSTTETARHLPAIVAALSPQGRFGLIDDPPTLDVMPFKQKSAAIHWELMFTRSMFVTSDLEAQHRLLMEVGELVDAGVIRTTLERSLGTISAANLLKAHALIESGRAKGKIVLEGF